jgi:hypothetical protein
MTNKKKVVVYICENGHPQEVSTDDWTIWDNKEIRPSGPPKQMMCWEPWEDDICAKHAIPLDRV